MSWALRFRIRQNLKGNLWVAPLLGGVIGWLLSFASRWLDGRFTLPAGYVYSAGTAQTILTTIVGAMIALTGFVVTVTVLVVQMSTQTFSARYMRIWYRDPVLKAVLAVLLCTLFFSFALLGKVERHAVPSISVTVAGLLVGAVLVLFLVFLDRYLHRLRPVAVAEIVGRAGREAVGAYSEAAELGEWADPPEAHESPLAGDPSAAVSCERSGAVQALNTHALVAWATHADRVLVMVNGIGDFLVGGTRLFDVYGGPISAADEQRLRGLVALGTERTIDQDPAFALRVMVDIANKALSTAINDPTTAVQVIDRVEELLMTIGKTPGFDGSYELRDAGGRRRVVLPAPRWDEFLSLGTTEIRQNGHSTIQVVRRLRSMLEGLREAVLLEYVPAVDRELERLDATVNDSFGGSVDFDLAGVSDRQGIGGAPGLPTPAG
ncbi:MAG TPA: DUF2254 domain-containing protein [Gaiellaceae bacterium]|nr:DUF2254 domain-containing protein [Gaiellaceae bacterium]